MIRRRCSPRFHATFLALAMAALVLPLHALAECGDVNGDGDVTSGDSLKVLKKAVGQDVTMTCDSSAPVFQNFMGYANVLTCYGYGFNSTMTWDEHNDFRWKDYSQPNLPSYPVYYRVDDAVVGGKIVISLGDCGTVKFPLDDWGIAFPMPVTGGAYMALTYDEFSDTLFLAINLSSFDTFNADTSNASRMSGPGSMVLGSVPAPRGISGPKAAK